MLIFQTLSELGCGIRELQDLFPAQDNTTQKCTHLLRRAPSLHPSVEGALPSLSPHVCQSLAVITGNRMIILNGIPYFMTPMENSFIPCVT